MVNIPKNLEKELGIRTLPKPVKKPRRWNLLIVGDDGKVIPVTRFKGLIIISICVLIAAILTSAAFYFNNKRTIRKSSKLTSALEESRRRTNALQDEKDILMTRLVLAESRIKEIQENSTRQTAPKKPSVKTASVEKEQPAPVPEKTVVDSTPEQAEEPAAPATPASEDVQRDGVSVEALTMFHEKDNQKLKVQFQIRKADPAIETISGYAFVILEGETAGPAGRLVFPSVKMISGKPSPINRGQYFSISRFKSMKFEKKNITAVDRYKTAVIIVFDTAGKLLMKKRFPVTIEERDTTPAA